MRSFWDHMPVFYLTDCLSACPLLQALLQVKKRLGDDAAVVHSQAVRPQDPVPFPGKHGVREICTLYPGRHMDLPFFMVQAKLQKFFGYCKLSGPGFMNAAFTLGAGSFASSVTLGAAYGYDMLWIPLYSFALGLFMLALATRFVTASEISVIKAQDKFHGKFFGSFATGLVACFVASIVYNFGQYALGADAVTALFSVVNINVPKNISWILLVAISVPLSLMYGSGDNPKGVKIVENAMKILIGIMLVVFGAVLCVTGVDFKAMIKGLLIPTLPSGIDGIVMLIASLTATIGVMDWVLFNNGMESRGYSENHETLGRFDAVFGGLIPVTLVLSFVSIAFAEAFAGQEGIPTDSTALCNALVSVIPSIWIQLGFYIGIIALVCSSMIGLSVTCATSFYQSTNVKKDTKAWYHPFIVLAPQIGFLGAFFGKPVMVVVFIAAMQSLFNWISGNSWYLLGNDPRYLGKKVIQSRFFNAGILACISVLNIVFITFIMSKMGVWPA